MLVELRWWAVNGIPWRCHTLPPCWATLCNHGVRCADARPMVVVANITSLRAHGHTVFTYDVDVVLLAEMCFTATGQRVMNTCARKLGWQAF